MVAARRLDPDRFRREGGGEATGKTGGAPMQHGSMPPSGLQVIREGGAGS